MATLRITRGDTSPALRLDLRPLTIDLTGASAVFGLRGALPWRPAAIASPSPPALQYDWQPGDTDLDPRLYVAAFRVTFASGAVETFSIDLETGQPLLVHVLDQPV